MSLGSIQSLIFGAQMQQISADAELAAKNRESGLADRFSAKAQDQWGKQKKADEAKGLFSGKKKKKRRANEAQGEMDKAQEVLKASEKASSAINQMATKIDQNTEKMVSDLSENEFVDAG